MPSQICSVPPASWTVGLLLDEPLLVAPGLIDHHGLSQLPWGSGAAPAPRFNPPDPQSCWRLTPLPTQPSAMPQGLATHRGGPPSLTPRKGKSRRWQVNSPSHHQTLLSHSGPTWLHTHPSCPSNQFVSSWSCGQLTFAFPLLSVCPFPHTRLTGRLFLYLPTNLDSTSTKFCLKLCFLGSPRSAQPRMAPDVQQGFA